MLPSERCRIVRRERLAKDAHRQAADEFRLEAVVDEILRRDLAEDCRISQFLRALLGAEAQRALPQPARDALLQAAKRAADDE